VTWRTQDEARTGIATKKETAVNAFEMIARCAERQAGESEADGVSSRPDALAVRGADQALARALAEAIRSRS
jgi:hypothetical protein